MNCPHHLMWIIPVRQGLHQCIQCWQVVGRKDVASKFEDLPPAFQQRWEEHEKAGQLDASAPVPKSRPAELEPPAKTPAPSVPGEAAPGQG